MRFLKFHIRQQIINDAFSSFLVCFLTFSVFLATTSGIIGGYIGVYLSLGWGIALLMFGINVFFNLDIMGDDPRYLCDNYLSQ